MHKNTIDLTNMRFGNLVVLELTDLKTEKKRCSVWKCKCDCGNITYKTGSDLRDKRRKTWSCGCMTRGNRKFPNHYIKKECLKHDDLIRIDIAYKIKEKLGHKFDNEIDEVLNELIMKEVNNNVCK